MAKFVPPKFMCDRERHAFKRSHAIAEEMSECIAPMYL
jgi:hypothetical protein